jgi:hypothetical protein
MQGEQLTERLYFVWFHHDIWGVPPLRISYALHCSEREVEGILCDARKELYYQPVTGEVLGVWQKESHRGKK